MTGSFWVGDPAPWPPELWYSTSLLIRIPTICFLSFGSMGSYNTVCVGTQGIQGEAQILGNQFYGKIEPQKHYVMFPFEAHQRP